MNSSTAADDVEQLQLWVRPVRARNLGFAELAGGAARALLGVRAGGTVMSAPIRLMPDQRRDDAAPSERLGEIARAVGRLSPDWTRPERFYERRSQLADEIRRLAARLPRSR